MTTSHPALAQAAAALAAAEALLARLLDALRARLDAAAADHAEALREKIATSGNADR